MSNRDRHRCPTHADQPGYDPSETSDQSDATLSAEFQSEWNVLFRQFRHEIKQLRKQQGTPKGSSDVALSVVTEALAIGEAMSSGTLAGTSPEDYEAIDSRHLEHRTRALRAALHGVDDYVWWGGMTTQRSIPWV